jgi:DNA-binding CsgD family transcriptional regulator
VRSRLTSTYVLSLRICQGARPPRIQGARGYLLFGCSLQDLSEGLRSIYLGGIALGPLVASRIADRMKQQALTRREGDILRHMMLGMSNKAIASKLTLAVGTVKTHVKSVLEKLDASSRTQAVSIAQRRGILREDEEGAVRSLRSLPHIGRPLLGDLHPPPSALINSTAADIRRI